MNVRIELLVLYSARMNIWKIIDFGNTVDGASHRARTTMHARGTAGYRAPELVSDSSNYTNKVDIWALGCILYELASGKQPFYSDWEVIQYSRGKWEVNFKERIFQFFEVRNDYTHLIHIIWELLASEWSERPCASVALRCFDSYTRVFVPKILGTPVIQIAFPRYEEWKTTVLKYSSYEDLLCELANRYEMLIPSPDVIASRMSTPIKNAVLRLWEELVREYPDNRVFRMRLAAAYARAGRYDNVIASLKSFVIGQDISHDQRTEDITLIQGKVPYNRSCLHQKSHIFKILSNVGV